MKRKITLFLVGILMSSYIPCTVLGRGYDSYETAQRAGTKKIESGFSRSPIAVQPKTLFVEPGANSDNAGTVQGNNDVESWVNGGYFEVSVPKGENVNYPMRVTLELNNAEWYFKDSIGNVKIIKDGEIKDNVYTPKNKKYKLELSKANSNVATLIIDKGSTQESLLEKNESIISEINTLLSGIKGKIEGKNGAEALLKSVTVTDNSAAEEELTSLKKSVEEVKGLTNKVADSTDPKELVKPDGQLSKLKGSLEAFKRLNYDELKAYLNTNDKDLSGKVDAAIKSIVDYEKAVNDKINAIKGNDDGDSDGNDNGGTKTEAATYEIPLIARTIAEGEDSTIRLTGSSSLPVETEKITFAIGTQTGLTTAVIRKPVTSRTNFEIEALGIKENRISALRSQGAFELVAPSGYEFRITDPKITTEGGIDGKDIKYTIQHRSTNSNNIDYSILQVIYSGIKPSTDITGALAITGLSLLDINNETVKEQDLYMNIRNLTGTFKIKDGKDVNITGNTITPQNVLVGHVRDWRVSLTPVGIIPTLVNGRLEGSEMVNVSDQEHKAVTVRFEEQVKDAWWSERVTKLTLPKNVKVRKATFERIRNINESDLSGVYYNNKNVSTGTGRVRIDDNVVTLSGITSKGEKASFDMNLWLSIEPGFTGNVDLKVSGSGITDNNRNGEDKGIVIAKAISPVELKAELTDAKIGYQYFTVGNFSITETAAGRLKANEDVYVSITDNSADSMQVDPNFKWEVAQGDLRVKNMNTKTQTQLGNVSTTKMNGALISFTIDKQSTTPSQISFKDVKVRLNNNYNSSSNKFDLVVWGPAIANNYRGLIDYNKNDVENKNINVNDYFTTPGISIPYIEANGSKNNSEIRNIVKVTVGNPIILVNNREVAMPTAAYVSPESNSTMVPVRFISTGLGIDESKIIWDAATGTVTIDAGSRIIQMQTNSDIITINGVEVPMLSPDGLRVKVEVKDNRAFIPFRTLGEAFGIQVGWNALTNTATYNDNMAMTKDYDLIKKEDLIRNNYSPIKESNIYKEGIINSNFAAYNMY